jgi:hypothetical protein
VRSPLPTPSIWHRLEALESIPQTIANALADVRNFARHSRFGQNLNFQETFPAKCASIVPENVSKHTCFLFLSSVLPVVAGLLDSLNACARDFERWRSLPDTDFERAMVRTMLDDAQPWILNGLSDLQRELGELLPKIEKYVDP